MRPIHANELLAGLALARPVLINAVVTDSRRVQPGCVFVCFPGARVDGHDFAAAAYRAGAEYIIANHPVEGVPEDHLVVTPSSHRAMLRMASNYRTLFNPLMIGVTGSVGKTTTKEFCYAVLSAFGNTLKTEGNQNNEIGLPNTLFRLDEATEYAVVEMGMSALGEIARLVRTARPAAGIITMIGVSHLENLGSRENILKAKLEICQGLPDGAPLVLNGDDAMLRGASLPGRLRPVWFGIDDAAADVRAEEIRDADGGTAFTLVDAEHGRRGEDAVTIPAQVEEPLVVLLAEVGAVGFVLGQIAAVVDARPHIFGGQGRQGGQDGQFRPGVGRGSRGHRTGAGEVYHHGVFVGEDQPPQIGVQTIFISGQGRNKPAVAIQPVIEVAAQQKLPQRGHTRLRQQAPKNRKGRKAVGQGRQTR